MSKEYHNPYTQPTSIDYRLVLAARVAEFEAYCSQLPEIEIPEIVRRAADESDREWKAKQSKGGR